MDSAESFDEDIEGTLVIPANDQRVAFAQHVYREILLIILHGNSLVHHRDERTGETHTFRLPPPEHILDFVTLRCTGKKYDGHIEAVAKVLFPPVSGESDTGEYLACELIYLFPEDQS